MDFVTKLKSFDIYTKVNEEFKIKTIGGAVVSITALIIISILFISELSWYLTVETRDHLYVDVSRGEKININFDVIFPHIPCSLLSLDAMDVSGSHQLDVSHHIIKKQLDQFGNPKGEGVKHELGHTLTAEDLKAPALEANQTNNGEVNSLKASVTSNGNGVVGESAQNEKALKAAALERIKQPNYCGSCYGAGLTDSECCKTCDEVKEKYRNRGWALPPLSQVEQCFATDQTESTLMAELDRHEGCQMYGYLQVNKVAGNFHFAPGKSFQHAHLHIHDLAAFSAGKFNVSHKIQSLSFGQSFPGVINPLDNSSKHLPTEDSAGMFMYYAKVVPTAYEYVDGRRVHTNQFSVTEHYRALKSSGGLGAPNDAGGLPGVFFFYELSPIMVRFEERRKSFFHFITQLCAILGGVFTVAGMVDRLVYSSMRHLQKKLDVGKLY